MKYLFLILVLSACDARADYYDVTKNDIDDDGHYTPSHIRCGSGFHSSCTIVCSDASATWTGTAEDLGKCAALVKRCQDDKDEEIKKQQPTPEPKKP